MWYNRIVGNISEIPNFIEYYQSELLILKKEIPITGSIVRQISNLPGITERSFSHLQEIEAVLKFLEIKLQQIQKKYFQQYLETYNRALTSKDAEKYASGEQEIIDFELLINEVALVRNKYLSLMKGLESKNWMLGHLTRLKTSGFEDFSI